jgi:hypothetical protein
MLKSLVPCTALLGCLAWANPASAWWTWFYAPPPGYGGPVVWSQPQVWSGLTVEQMPTPLGYSIRIHTGSQRAEDVSIAVTDGQLFIRSVGSQMSQFPGAGMSFTQFGGSAQWIALPPDADWSRMTLGRGGSLIEVFVPRRP